MRTDKSLAPKQAQRRPPAAGPPPLVVKTTSVSVLISAAGWNMAELAKRSRLDQSAVARLLAGKIRPGPRAIAGLLLAFSSQFPTIGFYDLFEVHDEDGTPLRPQVGGDGGGSEDIKAAS